MCCNCQGYAKCIARIGLEHTIIYCEDFKFTVRRISIKRAKKINKLITVIEGVLLPKM